MPKDTHIIQHYVNIRGVGIFEIILLVLLALSAGGAIWLFIQWVDNRKKLTSLQDDITVRQTADDLATMAGRVGTWTLDNISQRITWSDEVYSIHERPKHAGPPTLKQALGFYHHADRARVTELVNTALADGSDFEFRARIVTECDVERTILSRGVCQFDARGKVTAVFGAFIDLTETEPDKIQTMKPETDPSNAIL